MLTFSKLHSDPARVVAVSSSPKEYLEPVYTMSSKRQRIQTLFGDKVVQLQTCVYTVLDYLHSPHPINSFLLGLWVAYLCLP